MQQIQYLPGYPDNWRQEMEHKLDNHPNVEKWAYIPHDSDVDEDGKPVAPHIHLVLGLNESLNTSTIGNIIGVPQQYVSPIKQKIKAGRSYRADIGGALLYLTHRNAPEKHQYSDDQVVAKAGYDWIAERAKSEKAQEANKSFQKAIEGIKAGKIRRYNLTDYVSMDNYIDNKTEYERAFEYRENSLKNKTNRKISVIYIEGDAGSGKTTLAKKLCEDKGLSYCLSGSSRDPVQDYNGQDALILDDFRPGIMPLSDVLKMLDNNSASSVSARYHDRWLEVSLIIITSVLTIDDFYAAVADNKEPIAQLKRRCKKLIHLTRHTMDIYAYRAATQEYALIGSGPNPVAAMYADVTDDSEDDLKDFCRSLGIKKEREVDVMDVGMGADMHDVAWIPLTTGGYLLPIPGVTYKISKPLTDGTVFLYKNKKSAKSPMPLQFIFDWVYQDLRQKHANAKYIWCKSERKRWDNQPITHEQITLIKKLAPDYKINTKKTTRGDASAIIQNLLYIRQEGDKNAS